MIFSLLDNIKYGLHHFFLLLNLNFCTVLSVRKSRTFPSAFPGAFDPLGLFHGLAVLVYSILGLLKKILEISSLNK